ncbi:MAG TPA: hypothetical protein VNE82_24580 [Candidatus Binataceae bacterium]|nr:hypothetical protein [Candidatus Binataceae bacterium]
MKQVIFVFCLDQRVLRDARGDLSWNKERFLVPGKGEKILPRELHQGRLTDKMTVPG